MTLLTQPVLKAAIEAIWFILPAYVANGAPVVLARFIKNRHPMDFGRKFIDGRRILGDSKSWEGFVFGVLCGTLTAIFQSYLLDNYVLLIRGFILSVGALVGDCLGAFIKRRLGLPPGSPAPLLDQLSFLVVAMGLAYAFHMYTLNIYQTIFLIVLTPILHVVSNAIAYLLKLKNVPW